MFRGKESLNRIELSQLVQELLNFGILGYLQLWGWEVGGWDGWMGVGVVEGCPHICTHVCTCMDTHACTCMHAKHDNFMQMAAPLGKSLGTPYDVICMCVCVCVCMCAHMSMFIHVHICEVLPLTTPTHIHPPPTPRGDPRNQSKFKST